MQISHYNFEENMPEILARVNKALLEEGIEDTENYTIVPAFIAPTAQYRLTTNMNFDGPAISMIMVLNKNSGRFLHFSFAHLFPEIQIGGK